MSARLRIGRIALAAGIALAVLLYLRPRESDSGPAANASPEALLARGLALLDEQEAAAARDYWGPEAAAARYGQAMDQFWNALKDSPDKWSVLRKLPVGRVTRVVEHKARDLPHGLRILEGPGRNEALDRAAWTALLDRTQAAGWMIEATEFRHIRFDPASNSRPPGSGYYFAAHLTNDGSKMRAVLEGELAITWTTAAVPEIAAVDATKLQVRTRAGEIPFVNVLHEEVQPPEGSYFIDPLIVEDLDRDGSLEIILAAKNRVYRRTAAGGWAAADLCAENPRLIFTAILGDFTGDGALDFLCANFDGLLLYTGTMDGQFPHAPRRVWAAQPRLRYAQAITTGDIDGDGDLDLFLGQYRVPYENGQMPAPYFDANDSHPSFLLRNDGQGQFADITVASGLAAKRHRRAYSASLADLDGDGHLDLLVVSDFRGIDLWRNDGQGKFAEVTDRWLPEPFGFGMSHSFADFNRDGRIDLLMIGMNSPVADRLNHQRLLRPYPQRDAGMRARMTFGNRLWLGAPQGGFLPSPSNPAIQRAGWAWSAAAADLDNDGFPDLYMTNGHESRSSVQDYETEFWLHDIYIGDSQENPLMNRYFQNKFARTRGQGQSYGGHERNRLYLNLGGTNFVEIGHLFGVGLTEDSRGAVAADVTGDGKLDLILTTFEVWPRLRQTLQIFENRLDIRPARELILQRADAIGHMVQGKEPHPAAWLPVTGDGYRAQHPLRIYAGAASPTNELSELRYRGRSTVFTNSQRRVILAE